MMRRVILETVFVDLRVISIALPLRHLREGGVETRNYLLYSPFFVSLDSLLGYDCSHSLEVGVQCFSTQIGEIRSYELYSTIIVCLVA